MSLRLKTSYAIASHVSESKRTQQLSTYWCEYIIARVVGVWAAIYCLCSSPTVCLEQERELSAVGRRTDLFDINVARRLCRICSRSSTQQLIWILHTGMETVYFYKYKDFRQDAKKGNQNIKWSFRIKVWSNIEITEIYYIRNEKAKRRPNWATSATIFSYFVVRLLMLFSEREWITQYCPGEFTFYLLQQVHFTEWLLHNLARSCLQQRLSWSELSYFSDDATSS